jgi:hypothetical protein
MFTSKAFPADLDTTSLALTILKPEAETIHCVMDEMLEYVNEAGIIQVRIPPVFSKINSGQLFKLNSRPISITDVPGSTPLSVSTFSHCSIPRGGGENFIRPEIGCFKCC